MTPLSITCVVGVYVSVKVVLTLKELTYRQERQDEQINAVSHMVIKQRSPGVLGWDRMVCYLDGWSAVAASRCNCGPLCPLKHLHLLFKKDLRKAENQVMSQVIFVFVSKIE